MKKIKQAAVSLLIFAFSSYHKSRVGTQIILTPSSTKTTVGHAVSVVLSSQRKVINWKVSPSATATEMYGPTTSKVNTFTFSQPGVHTISVQTRSIAYNATLHQSLNSCRNLDSSSYGGCTQGVDTASVAIMVTGR